jgi:NAD+ kinase
VVLAIMKIGIITNVEKDKNLKITKQLVAWMKERNIELILEKLSTECAIEEATCCNDHIFKHSDIIISLGGDGTLLNVARQASCRQVPLFGINLGHLGFLTEAEVGDMLASLEKLIRGEYTIERRMMLEAYLESDRSAARSFIALNDIVVTKSSFSRLVTYSLYINDNFVDEYSADGLIISSPTGSTAYSLSAGGPIVVPDVEVILITPICPHTLHSRSILVSNKDLVRIEVGNSNSTDIIMTIDGQDGKAIVPGDMITVKQSKYYANLVKLSNRSFFDVLRAKMSERRDHRK